MNETKSGSHGEVDHCPLPIVRATGWIRTVLLLIGFLGLALAVFLSLRTSSALGTLSWIPRWLANWCDHHGSTRNFPAFVLMALPFLVVTKCVRHRAWMMAALAVLAVLLETAQLFIPTRVADVLDVLSSWAGLLVAWGMVEAIRICLRKPGGGSAG